MYSRRSNYLYAVLVLVFASLACNLPGGQVTPPPVTEESVATIEPTLPPTATPPQATSTPEQIATVEPSPTSQVVTITASGGNINIRRGPGVGYNPLAVFANGQSSVATARNADGTWLYISIPDVSGQTGWVNAKTQYSTVSGEINVLPVSSVSPPEPAYIRNCTFHEMIIKPGDVKLMNQTNSPDNKLQFNPGTYEVFDTTVSGSKSVKSINLREGDTVDIKKDGLGNAYDCP